MKHSIIRQTIIETASRLFYQQGYNLTGINEIIREAGIAKATLYSHFKSKDDICLAYLDYKDDIFLEEIKTFVWKETKGKNQLLALFNFLQIFYADKDFNGCWCLNTNSEIPREKQLIRLKIRQQKNNFLQFITQLSIANFPKKSMEENEVLAQQIYILYEGAIAESNLHGKSWPISTAKKLANQILS